MMATDHLFLYNKRTALNDWKPKKMQTYQIKSKPILDSVVLPFFFVLCLLPSSSVLSLVWTLGTNVCQSSPTQSSGFQFGCFCLDGGRLLVLGLILCPVRFGWGQMRVSWCQRLDGRMLSTFSMMKFRGANSVLRNYRGGENNSHTNGNEPDVSTSTTSFLTLGGKKTNKKTNKKEAWKLLG